MTMPCICIGAQWKKRITKRSKKTSWKNQNVRRKGAKNLFIKQTLGSRTTYNDVVGTRTPLSKRAIKKLNTKASEKLLARYAKNTLKNMQRPVKDWHIFCEISNREPIHIPSEDGRISPKEQLRMEEHLMRFTVWLQERKIVGRKRTKPLSGKTIETYLASIKTWHLTATGFELAQGYRLRRLQTIIKGMTKKTKVEREENRKKGRVGISARDIKSMRRTLKKWRCAKRVSFKDEANVDAAIQVCWQALLRAGEVTIGSAKEDQFDSERHLTRADVSFDPSFENYEYVKLRLPIMKVENEWTKTNEPFIFPKDDGATVSAAEALHNLFIRDPVKEKNWHRTPLFRDPKTKKAMKTTFLRKCIKKLYQEAGRGDQDRVGSHSLRIGGCSTLLANGESPIIVQALGRWSSDIYRIYCRQSKHSMLKAMKRMGRKSFSSIEKEQFRNLANIE